MNLPNEVLLILFEHLGSKDTKRTLDPSILALMKTCRRFRNLLLPIVFSETYSNSRLMKASLAGNTTAQLICTFVTHLSLSGHILSNTNPLTFPTRTLSHLSNLTQLTITDLCLDDATVLAISALTRLEALFFNAVSFVSTLSPSALASLGSLNLSSFALVGKPGKISSEIFGWLAQAVVSDKLRSVTTSYPDFTRAAMRHYLDANLDIRLNDINLSELNLDEAEDFDLFARFITCATELTEVRFPTRTRGPWEQLKTLFANQRVLPRLKKAEGLTRWASLLVPVRPLVQLKLCEMFFSDSTLGSESEDFTNLKRALGQSIGTLRHLDISFSVVKHCGKELFTALGGLKELKLECMTGLVRGALMDRNILNKSILDTLDFVPTHVLATLECIIFDFNGRLMFPEVSFDLAYQHKMLERITSVLPKPQSLKRFQTANDIWWNKDSEGKWMPFIPERAYSTIKDEMSLVSAQMRMEDMDVSVTDYGGVFDSLFLAESGVDSVGDLTW